MLTEIEASPGIDDTSPGPPSSNNSSFNNALLPGLSSYSSHSPVSTI